MERKEKNQLMDRIGLAVESTGIKVEAKALEEIVEFAVAKIENPLPMGDNPYMEGQINRTKQVQIERDNPELAKTLQEQAKRGLK